MVSHVFALFKELSRFLKITTIST